MTRPIHPIVTQLTVERKRRRLKQASVAARAGCHRNVLGDRERGEDRPTLDGVTAWARALGHRLVLVPEDEPATNGELAAFLYQTITEKPAERPEIPEAQAGPTEMDRLFQKLIGVLDQLLSEGDEPGQAGT